MTASVARRACVLLVLVAALLAGLAVGAGPVHAHESDPRVVTVLDDVAPALPAQVLVQVRASLASQLVVDNPTSELLEVLGRDGRPFLRLSVDGVSGDVAHPEFASTSSPTGAVPSEVADDQPPRWVRVSAGTSWGWFDHRLHPSALEPPVEQDRPARLADWTVPLRYGGADVQVRGHVQFQPLLGAFLVTAGPAPADLVVQALPGRLPGLFLANPESRPLEVLGRDGEPFLRFTPDGVQVNVASRTHVEDRKARGQPAGPPSPEPRFELLGAGADSWTWLDARLRYPRDAPPDDVLRADEPSVLSDWAVPAVLDGQPVELSGEVRWVPTSAGDPAMGPQPPAGGPRVLPLALGLGALLVVGGAAVALRRSRRSAAG